VGGWQATCPHRVAVPDAAHSCRHQAAPQQGAWPV